MWPMTASTNRNVISTAGLLFYTQYTINHTTTSDVIPTGRYGRHNGLLQQTPILLNLMYVTAQRLLYILHVHVTVYTTCTCLNTLKFCFYYMYHQVGIGFEASRCWTVTARHFKFTNTPACHINLTNWLSIAHSADSNITDFWGQWKLHPCCNSFFLWDPSLQSRRNGYTRITVMHVWL
jgi:hypothetical protein